MKLVMIAVLVGGAFAAALGACASTSSGGGSGATGGYGTGGVSAGGSSAGGSSAGGSSAGGSSAGGSSAGGSSAGGSSAGGSSSGGASGVNLPSGCANGVQVNCNPITNAGCDSTAGQACDLGQDSSGQPGLGCFDPPNTQQLNQTCSNGQSGPFCQGTLHCSGETDAGGGTCKKFCCSSSDCGGGVCNAIDAQLGTLGTCN